MYSVFGTVSSRLPTEIVRECVQVQKGVCRVEADALPEILSVIAKYRIRTGTRNIVIPARVCTRCTRSATGFYNEHCCENDGRG